MKIFKSLLIKSFYIQKDILKKYPFYAVGIGGFYDSFEEGMNKKSEKVVFVSNLKIMPKLKKLKDFINFNEKKKIKHNKFIHSHKYYLVIIYH